MTFLGRHLSTEHITLPKLCIIVLAVKQLCPATVPNTHVRYLIKFVSLDKELLKKYAEFQLFICVLSSLAQ
jgi:hypothetical protein